MNKSTGISKQVSREDFGDAEVFHGYKGEAIIVDENGSIWRGTLNGYRNGDLGELWLK